MLYRKLLWMFKGKKITNTKAVASRLHFLIPHYLKANLIKEWPYRVISVSSVQSFGFTLVYDTSRNPFSLFTE